MQQKVLDIGNSLPPQVTSHQFHSFHLWRIPMEALQHGSPHSNLHKIGGNWKIKICWTLKEFSTEHAWSHCNLQRANEKSSFWLKETVAAVIQSLLNIVKCRNCQGWKHHRDDYLVFPTLLKVATNSKWVDSARTRSILMTASYIFHIFSVLHLYFLPTYKIKFNIGCNWFEILVNHHTLWPDPNYLWWNFSLEFHPKMKPKTSFMFQEMTELFVGNTLPFFSNTVIIYNLKKTGPTKCSVLWALYWANF